MTSETSNRIRSLDVLRGLVCILMAIDHVRVYAAVPAGGVEPALFFTRWVTHFVAPVFCFFAGTGAFFQGRKLGDTGALARYLVTRGAFLVLLELTVIRFSWTFNFDYSHYVLAGVIWMLGWCMVLLALLVRFSPRVVGLIGIVIVACQQVVTFVPTIIPSAAWPTAGRLFAFFYYVPEGMTEPSAWFNTSVLYVIIPWIGVMALGYWFGLVMLKKPAERDRACLELGVAAVVLFLFVGSIVAAYNLRLASQGLLSAAFNSSRPFWFRLLTQNKYPPSQLFLLMTLGPALILIPVAERARGWFVEVLRTFGRVPMFYYLLHIPLIHLAAVVVAATRVAGDSAMLVGNYPMAPPKAPDGYRWSLALLYLVWAICVALLYPACRWYDRLKSRHPNSLLRYI